MTTEVGIRLGIDGDAEVKQGFQSVGQTGDAAMSQVSDGADKAGAALDRLTKKYQAQAAAAKQAALASDAQSNFNSILGVGSASAGSAQASAAVFQAAADAEEALAAKTLALRAAIDPLSVAQTKFNTSVETAKELLAASAITEAEYTAAVTLAEKVLNDAKKAHDAYGSGVKLNSAQLAELEGAARHSFDALAAGANPLTVLAQHAATLGQALGSGEGGIQGGLKAVLSLISVEVVAVAALGVAIIGAVALEERWSASQAKVKAALEGSGRASGVTVDQFNAYVDSAAKAADVSESAARDIATAMVTTGKVTGDNLIAATAVVKGYATATGEDLKTATQQLATAFADPAKGASTLTDKLGFLNGAQLDTINKLQAAGDKAGALKILIDALTAAVPPTNTNLTTLGKTLDGLKNFFVNAADGAGQFFAELIHGQSATNQLKSLQNERNLAVNGFAVEGDGPPRALQEIDADIARVNGQIAQAQTKAQAVKNQVDLNNRSIAVQQAADTLDSTGTQIKKIQEEQATLRAAQSDPALQKASGRSSADIAAALAAGDKQIEQLKKKADATDKHAQTLAREAAAEEVSAQQGLLLAQAYLTGDAAAEQAEARRKALTDATKKGTDTEAEARRQIALSVADAAVAGGKQVATLTDQANAQKAANDAVDAGTATTIQAQRQMQVDQALRPLLTAQALAEGQAKTVLTQVIQKLRDAYVNLNTEQDRQAVQSATSAANDNLAVLQKELSIVNETVDARERDLAAFKAMQELKTHPNVSPTSTDGQNFLNKKAAEEDAQIALDKANYVRETTQSQQNSIDLTEKEIALVGTNAEAHDVIIAQLKAEQDLHQKGIDAQSQQGQLILQNAADQAILNQKLQLQQQSLQVVQQLTDSVFSSFTDLIAQGKLDWADWGSAALSAIGSIESQLLKLAILNPLENSLFGTNSPTLSSVGGILGSILHIGAPTASGTGGMSVDQINASISDALDGHNASGTSNWQGGMTWVGENGPELVNLPTGTSVYSNSRSASMAANNNRPIQVVIQTPNPQSFQASRAQIAATLTRSLQQAQRIR